MEIWRFIKDNLDNNNDCILLVVIDSTGSSPGRKGFKMVIDSHGQTLGSIGGGIMEYNWIKDSKERFCTDKQNYIIEVNHKLTNDNPSGLICSGSQTIASIKITKEHIDIVKLISLNQYSFVIKNNENIILDVEKKFNTKILYSEGVKNELEIIIFGGGHVGSAMAELLNFYKYNYTIIDNREDIICNLKSRFKTKHIDYNKGINLSFHSNMYIIIMTQSMHTDIDVLKAVIDEKYKFLGLMGSIAKKEAIYSELLQDKITSEDLDRITCPIGLNINSHTPQEIAISVLGQIISINNKFSHSK